MRHAILLLAVAPLTARADTSYHLVLQVSHDGFFWDSTLNTAPDQPIFCRLSVAFERTLGAEAWASLAFTQIDVTGSGAGDLLSGVSGKFQPLSQTLALLGAGVAGSIDRADDPALNVQFAQLPLNNGGSTDNPIVVLNWTYTPVLAGGGIRDIQFSIPLDTIKSTNLYGSGGGFMVIDPVSRTTSPSVIHVTPAPGAILPLLAGAVFRRRPR